jgi:hypothetical protein
MLYFAYGSNMDCAQMRERCPSARFVGIAVLPDHRLAFTRESVTRQCGVADVVPETGHKVWGVVYEIGDGDVNRLDSSEGFRPGRRKNSYWRRECAVHLMSEVARSLPVQTYFAEQQSQPPMPNDAYKRQIVAGARFWQLPADYVFELERIEVTG